MTLITKAMLKKYIDVQCHIYNHSRELWDRKPALNVNIDTIDKNTPDLPINATVLLYIAPVSEKVVILSDGIRANCQLSSVDNLQHNLTGETYIVSIVDIKNLIDHIDIGGSTGWICKEKIDSSLILGWYVVSDSAVIERSH